MRETSLSLNNNPCALKTFFSEYLIDTRLINKVKNNCYSLANTFTRKYVLLVEMKIYR